MTINNVQPAPGDGARPREIDERIESLGWGILLIVIGAIWLMPEKIAPPGTWLIATGLILLGLNALRYAKHVPVRGFGIVVGLVALCAGLRARFDLDLPLFPIALIVLGTWLLLRQIFERAAVQRGWSCCKPS